MNTQAPALDDDGLRTGFDEPVRDAQYTFRLILEAMSRPGTIIDLGLPLTPPSGLSPAAAAVCLALADVDTPIYLEGAARTPAVETFLRFHTGASVTEDRGPALFAVCDGDAAGIDGYQLGTDEHPDRSATLIVQVAGLEAAGGLRLTGPGIKDQQTLGIKGLHPARLDARQALAKAFPRGLVTGAALAALPRTTTVTPSGGHEA